MRQVRTMIEQLNRQRLEAAARLDREAEQTSPCNETRAARIRETAAMCALAAMPRATLPRHVPGATTARQWRRCM